MYKLMRGNKVIDTFDLFSDAWVYARLYYNFITYIKDMNSGECHMVIPAFIN